MRNKLRATAAHREKMKLLFAHADDDKDGQVSLKEFVDMMAHDKDGSLKLWMSSMDFDISDVERLFLLMDLDGDGRMNVDELLVGATKLKGAARAMDVQLVMKQLQKVQEDVARPSSAVEARADPLPSAGAGRRREARKRTSRAEKVGEFTVLPGSLRS